MSETLPAALARLRQTGRFDEARRLLTQACREHDDPRLRFLAWQHEPFWWQPMTGPRAHLRRRGPADIALVRQCWTDASFMARFNRQAAALPASDDALQSLLAREYAATAENQGALHWTIDSDGKPVGFASLVELAITHRRAEFLIGVRPGTRPWVAVEAAHLVLQFAARQMRLERLAAHFYPDNTRAISAALKLGFEHEGLLRGHLRDAVTGRRQDLVVTGLLLDEAFAARSERLRRRLFGDPAVR
jgi:RimJ/RimL family protein N-acetyltransferase